MTCLSASVSRFWRVFSDSFLFVFCQLSDYGLKHWNAGEGPCLTVKFEFTKTKSSTFLLHLKICFHHHVLVWPNSNMLSSFCQRLCKSTWGGVLILLPKGFIKYTFYQITFYKRTCCCQDLFSNETWNNIDATATLFWWVLCFHISELSSKIIYLVQVLSQQWPCQALSHFTVTFLNVLHYQIVLSFFLTTLQCFSLLADCPAMSFQLDN